MQGRAVAAGNIKDNAMAHALTEHRMSMSDPVNATVIDRRVLRHSTGGHPL
jgi:hypothetical protein